MKWHSIHIEDVYKKLKTSSNGISIDEAKKRLKKFGYNEIKREKSISILKILINQFTSPLVLILVIAAIISFFIEYLKGESFFDSILIILIVILNGLFGFIQDYKAEKSIEMLKSMSRYNCIVLRSGKRIEIDSRMLVPGDIVYIEEGMKVPADCRIIKSINLAVDESMLTGESVPVSKKVCVLKENTIVSDRINMIFMNTNIVRGKGIAVVVETGMNTEIGKIAKQISEVKEEKSLFDIEISSLAKKIGSGILILIILIALTQIIFTNLSLVDIFITSIALAVAAIPEGLPAVVTLSLAIGTRKMLRRNTLVRKLSIIEMIGSINVICSDKTGTITEGDMKVVRVFVNNKSFGSDEIENDNILFVCAKLCNNAFFDVEAKNYRGDPTEIALLKVSEKTDVSSYVRIKEIPFSSERKMMSVVCKHEKNVYIFSKGAVETILDKCDYVYINGNVVRLTRNMRDNILKTNLKYAKNALRVLAFAFREGSEEEKKLVFIGLVGMKDPVRKMVKNAINACKDAGIRVVMITGDNAITAKAIAREIGLKEKVIEGKDIDRMNEKEFRDIVMKYDVFARVVPEHKVKILKALQDSGYVVAMTGDGINDAPAIKNADVGIAMGIKGTDITKQTSDIVLMDDNFVTIKKAIETGRNIFLNIRNFVNYLLSSNFAEVFVVFIASLFGMLPIKAVHLLWINLITDGMPALALGIDEGRKDVMKRKPKPKGEGILNKEVIVSTITIGTIYAILILYLFFSTIKDGIVVAQTVVFTSFIIFEFGRILMIRKMDNIKFFSNKWLWLSILASFFIQLIIIYSPISVYFSVVPITFMHWEKIIYTFFLSTIFAYLIGYLVNKHVK